MIRLIKWNADGNPEFGEFRREPPLYAMLWHARGSTNDEANHKMSNVASINTKSASKS
jgi:hypothetical protein